MLFYENTPALDIIPHETEETRIEDILSESKYLNKLDILNFNYYLFESDLEKLNDYEFKIVLDKLIHSFIGTINENYIDIEIDIIIQDWSELEKKSFIKKFILFVMHVLPYEILKPILQNLDQTFESDLNIAPSYMDKNDVISSNQNTLFNIFDYDNQNIVNLKPLVISGINKKINKLKNFENIIDEISEISKKNTLEDSRDMFEIHIQKQITQYKIYIGIIEQTDLEKIVNLFREYIKNDYLNLIN